MSMNWPIFLIAIGYGFAENAYFGWNIIPQSDAEMIADGIGLILFALSFLKVDA